MPQALITVNGTAGSNDDLALLSVVALNNQNTGGELTYNWVLVSRPETSAAALSSAVIQNPTLTLDREGSYVVELIVNLGLASEQRDRVIVAVRDIKTGLREPAADEQTEDGATGWAPAVNQWLSLTSTLRSDPGTFIGVCDYVGGNRGDVVMISGSYTLANGQVLPRFIKADATNKAFVFSPLGILETTVYTNDIAPNRGDLCYVRTSGLFRLATLASGYAAGSYPPVYMTNTGGLDGVLLASRYPRKLGQVVVTYDAVTVDINVDTLSIPTPSIYTWGCQTGTSGSGTGWMYPGFSTTAAAGAAIYTASPAGIYYDLRVIAQTAPTGGAGTHQQITLGAGGMIAGPFVYLDAGATAAELTSGALSASIPVAASVPLEMLISDNGLVSGAVRLVATMSFLPA